MPPESSPASLKPVADEIWQVELHRREGGLHLRNRMTVIRLENGGLWIVSPVPLDDPLATQLATLGPVEHIVAPSCFHHLFAGPAHERYPGAMLWAAPGLARKRPDLRFDGELLGERPTWTDEIDRCLVDGVPRIREVVFFHRRSRSLLCFDYLFNVHQEHHTLTRWVWRLMGVWRRFGQSRPWRLMTRDPAASAAAARVIRNWPVERVVPAHGDILEHDVRPQLEAALAWLPEPTS